MIQSRKQGFTLMELMTVIVIICILAVILVPAVQGFRARTYRLNCTQNLKALHVAATNYMQTNHSWPQHKSDSPEPSVEGYERSIYEALKPFGAEPKVWVCPGVQHAFNHPDYTKAEFFRIDYLATPFDSGQTTPFRWSSQPWFAEKSDMHGEGPLLIFSSGEVFSLKDVLMGRKY